MLKSRLVALGLVTLGIASAAFAQIDGPTPLSWRWTGSTSVAPSGVPTVDGENIFVGVGGRIYCIDKASGNKKWQFPLIEPIDGYFQSTPILANGLVIASGTNKTIYAIDPVKGEKVWTYDAPGAIVGNPVLAGKYVIFSNDANSLMAIDADDGKPVWTNPERIFDGVMGGLASYNSDVFFFTRTRELWVMKTTTKKATKLARFQSLSPDAKPVISGDLLYVASGNYMIAMNPVTGVARWQTATPQSLIYGGAVSLDGIAVGTQDGKVIIMDSDGNIKTSGPKRTPMILDLGSRPIASPASVGKLFAVPTANGSLSLIDPIKGEIVWSYVIRPVTAGLKVQSSASSTVERNGEIVSVPAAGSAVLAGQTMLVLAMDGSLLSFDKTTGVDLTGPLVRLMYPTQGAQVGTRKGPLDVYIQISDDATGVNDKALKITVNDNPVDFTYGRDGIAVLHFGTGLKNSALNDGRATFTVTAIDWMGNQTIQTFSLMIDNDLAPLAKPKGTQPDGTGAGSGPGKGSGVGG